MAPRHLSRRKSDDEYGEFAPLFGQMAGLDVHDPRREELRSRIITGYLPLADHIARRYSSRGIAKDDLAQVATVGLIRAIDRFDHERGEFLSFAVPTVMGEVRRHFRDTAWPVRLPRRLQEVRMAITTAALQLSQTLGRPATAGDLAERLGIPESEVLEGLEAIKSLRSVSLDQPVHEDGLSPVETIGSEDLALELVDNLTSLLPLLRRLPTRERQILALRFFGEKTQSQIGTEIGVSQMHVSRLLKSTLTELRAGMLTPPPQDTTAERGPPTRPRERRPGS
ncbi:SigB/SigF/SigG family RNA polymerase sigma factor [Glycomyces tritici]|uniref:SigB/SigF/SigG family RNA polymerase sigma factor n=1 Tax=Glycomyces tritici TaxID=2665176 RepID=A0ABT7YT48_9ACTN|nr:SigB/SigF/SigG family RNA polymerase sigma factor [Glycomyces tritici]MDN3241814.1 SigB/SigF/SigG family RNA polymerase sigma factor [Glycomyces tritici]MDN3243717.1 SigB/SigF/SigG family RNA polymerase sigma factor [Glycomyces tritici]